MFLEINGLSVPVEEGSASGGNSARVPLRNEYGGAENASFGAARNWRCKTSFLTRDEADRLNALFVGYKDFPSRYAESWAGRGISGVTQPFPVPYLGVRGTMVGSSSYIRCEGRVAGTEWVTRNLVTLDLEIYEVQPANSPMDTSYDSGEQPGTTPIPDPEGGGGGESPFEQLPFVEPPRNTQASYITGVPFGPIYTDPGPYYDASGNEIGNDPYGDYPADGIYYQSGDPVQNRVYPGSVAGEPSWTRNPGPGGHILYFGKDFTGPGELTFNWNVDTTPYDGGLTVYAQSDEGGFRMLVENQRQGGGRVSVILPREQVWRMFVGFVGENPDMPSGNAGTNTFHIWDLNFEPSAIDTDETQAPSTPDELGERNGYANTVPSGKTNLYQGFFSSVGDELTETRTGKKYTSTHAFSLFYGQYLGTPAGMTPGSVAILRKRLSGPGRVSFDTSITTFSGDSVWMLTMRVANLETNFTYAMREQRNMAQYSRTFDVCGGVPELQVIAELISGTPESSELNCWVDRYVTFSEGAGHGPQLHTENEYPVPDSDGDGVGDDVDPYPYDPSLDGIPNPDEPYDRDNPATLGVPPQGTEITDSWYYREDEGNLPMTVIPGGFSSSPDEVTNYVARKFFQGPGVLSYDLNRVAEAGLTSFWITADRDLIYGSGDDTQTGGAITFTENPIYEVQFVSYGNTGAQLDITNLVYTPS